MNEFMQIYALGVCANRNLSLHGGRTAVSFDCTIGQSGAPHSLPAFHAPATAPHHRPCHRGRAERKRNRLRGARHQAARVVSSSPPVLFSTETDTLDSSAYVVSSASVQDSAPVIQALFLSIPNALLQSLFN